MKVGKLARGIWEIIKTSLGELEAVNTRNNPHTKYLKADVFCYTRYQKNLKQQKIITKCAMG